MKAQSFSFAINHGQGEYIAVVMFMRTIRNMRRRFALLLLIMTAAALFLIIDWQIRPMIRATAAYHASFYATNLMNEAVEQELEKVQGIQLVQISQNEKTNITSVTLDMLRINQIKTGITEQILIELSSEET